jgi:hypothetical protein
MTAKAIGVQSHMRKTKVSRAVALLERRKLVTRRTNRADLREAFLSLTSAGRQIYSELAPIALDFARELLETVDSADRAALDRALKTLTERSAQLARPISPTDAVPARLRRCKPGSIRETLFLFPLLRRLPRAYSAQCQGPPI